MPGGPELTAEREGGDSEDVAEAEPVGDLDRFSGDFSEIEEEGSSRPTRGGDALGDHDPEEIAQAIHTVIARDEKG